MTKQSWLPPEPKPFERLNVRDGLLIDASKWKLEHNYLRKRQSYHYQSLNQGGIVCGLEVSIIPYPPNVRPEYRTGRWVEISPGVAIDHQGNIIVVPEPRKYRIDAQVPPQKTSQTIYLVLKYRDPDDLHGTHGQEVLTEQFRLDEKSEPPSLGDIEVCRFELLPGEVELKPARDVFFPDYNTLDLRYRPLAQWRSQGTVKVAMYDCGDPTSTGLYLLLNSLRGLYGFLEGSKYIEDTFLTPEELGDLQEQDLLYLTEGQFSTLEPLQLETIQQYIQGGGTILIDGCQEHSGLAKLEKCQQELSQALNKVITLGALPEKQQEIEVELTQIKSELTTKFNDLKNRVQRLGVELNHWQDLPPNHPLKIEPFLFIMPPVIKEYQNQIWLGEGVVLLLGNLSSAWALSPQLMLSREILRNAQEMGINLLNYAWRRKLLNSLQKNSQVAPSAPPLQPIKPSISSRTMISGVMEEPSLPISPEGQGEEEASSHTPELNLELNQGEEEIGATMTLESEEEISVPPSPDPTEENEELEKIDPENPDLNPMAVSSEKRKRPKPSDLL